MTLIANLHQDDVADEDNMTRIELHVQETAEKNNKTCESKGKEELKQTNLWISISISNSTPCH